MNLLVKLLYRYLPHDSIGGSDEDNKYKETKSEKTYMRRFYLFKCRWFWLRIHEIMLSDEGDLHDHPFSFISFVLYGGYKETTPKGCKEYKPFSVIFRKSTQLHKLELIKDKAWTFVIAGPRNREWGFMTSEGWIHWKDYNKSRFVEKKI